MKIGIVSDSHGKAGPLRAAAAILVERGAEALVHCGDAGSLECVEALAAAGVPAYLVAGNMDRHFAHLSAAAAACGVTCQLDKIEVPLGDGRSLAATHGHIDTLLNELVLSERFAYICHGHTHRFRDDRFGPTRVLCPGALNHPKAPRHPTVLLLDTESDSVEQIRIDS